MTEPRSCAAKIVFSMPAGTPANKVLAAVKDFAREEFGAKHRYAMVLHTDEPHSHVHMVVKAMGYDGTRLNIRKATLREWRRQFAQHLREHGVAANATERAARGVTRSQKRDGIYRAERRRDSKHWRQLSPIGVMEPGMIGIMEPVFGRPNGHPDRVKNEQISERSQALISRAFPNNRLLASASRTYYHKAAKSVADSRGE
jgi:Plasmid recombination enzyme